MPKRVLVIGLIFCFGGVAAICEVLSSLFVSRISINFAVLLLPVGVGLLRGKRSSQWWARFWIILGYVVCGLMAVIVLVSPAMARARWFQREIRGPEAVPYVIAGASLFFLFLLSLHSLLYSKKASSYFAAKGEPGDAPPGNPTASLGNSGASEGPPSVS